MKLSILAALIGWASIARAHSHLSYFIINGGSYQGFDPRSNNTSPLLAAWSTSVAEDGWIGFSSYDLPDIVCHVNASSPSGYAPISAGDRIHLQWMGWPEGHHGPVLTYLARCGDHSSACGEANKTELEFFEIGRAGLLDPDIKSAPYEAANGFWATDELIAGNHSWIVEIPPRLSPGFYVLRHELIALHYATNPALGPQHYPQCINLQVIGDGTELPQGTTAENLYEKDEPGLMYDIYAETLATYTIPGPTLAKGAVGTVEQTRSAFESQLTAWPVETGGV